MSQSAIRAHNFEQTLGASGSDDSESIVGHRAGQLFPLWRNGSRHGAAPCFGTCSRYRRRMSSWSAAFPDEKTPKIMRKLRLVAWSVVMLWHRQTTRRELPLSSRASLRRRPARSHGSQIPKNLCRGHLSSDGSETAVDGGSATTRSPARRKFSD
jgi:hypothetical protein